MATEARDVPRAAERSRDPARVMIVDFEMPIGSMVVFMVKWAIAAIPAVIILLVVGAFAAAALGGIFGGLLN